MIEKALIPNKQIEDMFLRIADDDQVKIYTDLGENGLKAPATAYASNIVTKRFFKMVEGDI